MILMTAKIIKILLLLAVMAAGYIVLRKKQLRGWVLVCLGISCVVFALAANALSSHVPPLTDEITLTALGEKDDASKGYEVVVNGFSIDGQNYLVDKVAEGKWYWRGDQYMWRPETDIRQPEGTTRSVSLAVPVGWSRTIRFSANEYRGLVDVSTNGGTETVDTSVNSSAEIGRSKTSRLIWNYVIVLAVYTVVFVSLSGVLFLVVKSWTVSPQKWNEFCKKYLFHISLAGIICCAFVMIRDLCGQESLWQDEFALIHYITQTDSIVTAMLTDIAWLPLWKGIMFIWYRLVPYGEKWLILLPELCFLPGIYFTGLCGKELFNRRVGLLSAIIVASSARLLIRAASDLTCYSFLFSLSAIILYLYIKWTRKEKRNWRDAVPMVFVMVLASYTHYFGFFLSGTLFLIELVKCAMKKIKPKALLPYVVVGIMYIPWMYYILVICNAASADYWQPKPTLSTIPEFIKNLNGGIPGRFYLLLIGIIYLVILYLYAKKNGSFFDPSICLLAWIPLILTTCVFLYGKYIALGNTFWVWTYFIVLVPCFTVTIAVAVDGIYMLCACSGNGKNRAIAVALLLFSILFSVDNACDAVRQWTKTSSEPFRETAEWINDHWDYMYDPETIIVSGNYSSNTEGMIQYYVTQKGKIALEDVNIADITKISDDEILSNRRVILLKTVNVGGGLRERVDDLCEKLDHYYTQTEAMNDIKLYVYERNNEV